MTRKEVLFHTDEWLQMPLLLYTVQLCLLETLTIADNFKQLLLKPISKGSPDEIKNNNIVK